MSFLRQFGCRQVFEILRGKCQRIFNRQKIALFQHATNILYRYTIYTTFYHVAMWSFGKKCPYEFLSKIVIITIISEYCSLLYSKLKFTTREIISTNFTIFFTSDYLTRKNSSKELLFFYGKVWGLENLLLLAIVGDWFVSVTSEKDKPILNFLCLNSNLL